MLGYIVCISNGSLNLIWFILAQVICTVVTHVPVCMPSLANKIYLFIYLFWTNSRRVGANGGGEWYYSNNIFTYYNQCRPCRAQIIVLIKHQLKITPSLTYYLLAPGPLWDGARPHPRQGKYHQHKGATFLPLAGGAPRPPTPQAGRARLSDKWWQVRARNYINQFDIIFVDYWFKYNLNQIIILNHHRVILL